MVAYGDHRYEDLEPRLAPRVKLRTYLKNNLKQKGLGVWLK
jgi:hypothetical protein